MTDPIKNKPHSVFTYEVKMTVSVFAENEQEARTKLDQDGGFVSHRNVELKDAIELYDPET
jgi:hypothetical protein